MTIIESGVSHLPEKIQSAIAREPIILGAESIGTYFRNGNEITDLESVIAQQEDVISVGLVGSRLNGKFSYTGLELFNRMCFFYQRSLEMENDENDLFSRSDHKIVPSRFHQRFNGIADLLNLAQKGNDDLGDIDLSKLFSYSDYPEFLTFEPWIFEGGTHSPIPPIFYPKGFEYQNPNIPTFLKPAAYFPDIDIALITNSPLKGSVAWYGDTIGQNSGVKIQAVPIRPFEEARNPSNQEIIESMLGNFRPFSIPVPAK